GALSLNAESKPEEIAKVLPKKEALIVAYCSNLQCPASKMLYKHLKSLGYTNVLKYPEGLQGWKDAGYPIKPAK
ncbi:MAG: rhodanese-like domain-containing protein, partial [Candidatus Riflebacteria bacterium]